MSTSFVHQHIAFKSLKGNCYADGQSHVAWKSPRFSAPISDCPASWMHVLWQNLTWCNVLLTNQSCWTSKWPWLICQQVSQIWLHCEDFPEICNVHKMFLQSRLDDTDRAWASSSSPTNTHIPVLRNFCLKRIDENAESQILLINPFCSSSLASDSPVRKALKIRSLTCHMYKIT